MDLQDTANVAAIFGAISIFLTLIFVMLEIRLNLKQFRAIKEISLHDVQNQFFLHWSDPGNAEMILKAREDFGQLSEKEKFIFENYVELRIRFFVFGIKIIKDPKTMPYQISRIAHFFSHQGTYDCYQKMYEEMRIPPIWSEIINASLEDKNPKTIFKIANKGF